MLSARVRTMILVMLAVLASSCDFLASDPPNYIELGGFVKDEADVAVAGVQMRRSFTATYTVASAEDGRFSLGVFPAGSYDLDIIAPTGFDAPSGAMTLTTDRTQWRIRITNTSETAGLLIIRVHRIGS